MALNVFPLLTASATVAAMVGTSMAAARRPRTTSDFYLASRSVTPLGNASAISSEYMSAAFAIGVAGTVLSSGASALWVTAGAVGGYLVMLALVTAPLRRCGVYSASDFTEWRLGSRLVRRFATASLAITAWIFLLAQLRGAGLTLAAVGGLPAWAGWLTVVVAVLIPILSGGMRSITVAQAVQFWLKLAIMAIPALALVALWRLHGSPAGHVPAATSGATASHAGGAADHPLYTTYSLLVAMLLGTMGLPQLVIRFYANASASQARRTAFVALCLLAGFFLIPPIYGALARIYLPALPTTGNTDATVLMLPAAVSAGTGAQVLTALVTAGAFAAFLSAAAGTVAAFAGAISQCMLRTGIGPYRIGALLAVTVPVVAVGFMRSLSTVSLMSLAFSVAAATLCPLFVLGIWWRRLTDVGAGVGLVGGLAMSVTATALTMFGAPRHGWMGAVFADPALCVTPVTFALMIGISLLTPGRIPAGVRAAMARLHVPERGLDRSQTL